MSTFTLTPGTVNSQLQHWSQTDPDTPAFIFYCADPNNRRLTLTRRDVFTYAARYAAILRRKGIQHGDLVCNTLPNSPERLLTDLGIFMAGAVSVHGVVFLADGADLLGALTKSGSVAIITSPKESSGAMTALREKLNADNEIVRCPEAPKLRLLLEVELQADKDGVKPFLDKLKKEEEEYVADVQPSDKAFYMTTSGSTGFSKLVPRTHAELLKMGRTLVKHIGLQETDVYFNDRSMGWIGGAPIAYMVFGSTRILVDLSTPPADPLALVWEICAEEGVTFLVQVPIHIIMSLSRPELWQQKNVYFRRLVTGGQPVNQNHLRAIGQITEQVVLAYGSTEVGIISGHVLTANDIDGYVEGDVGDLSKDNEVKLMDENDEVIETVGKMGEILLRTDTMFSGYVGQDSNQTDCFTKDGFFRTSDIGCWDSQGHLHVICRKQNAIIHGAFVVYPEWLEARICKCPGVQQVLVIPVPDPAMYQELCACVLPYDGVKITEEDIKEFCKSIVLVDETSEMSPVPRYYVFFDSFPTTGTGKTDRQAIKKIALERLGVQDGAVSGKAN